jgi:hypothetical protein
MHIWQLELRLLFTVMTDPSPGRLLLRRRDIPARTVAKEGLRYKS